MFKLNELVRWLGITEFEMFTNLSFLLIFTVILAFKLAGQLLNEWGSWYVVFAPLFCSDICNGYFSIIVCIRMYCECENKRKAMQRIAWSAQMLVLKAIFKYLLCLKLSGAPNLEYSEVFAPIFVLLQLIAVRACQLSTTV